MKTIVLTKGKFALVDDEDFERVSRFKWHANKPRLSKIWYAQTTFLRHGKKVHLYMHRFILPHNMPRTDHKDRNGLNNQKENLRPCTRTQNQYNRNVQVHSSSYKGVSYFKVTKRWHARFYTNGKLVHLGYFSTAEQAAEAYDREARRNAKDFALTNQTLGLLPA